MERERERERERKNLGIDRKSIGSQCNRAKVSSTASHTLQVPSS
jgi:hypothetical protein